jgi:hypothetical protein
MKFMITFNHVDGVWDGLTDDERQSHGKWIERFIAELKSEKAAQLVFLTPAPLRKTVRKRSGESELVVEDGPAIPGPEQVGGYFIIEADSMDEAVEWAKKGRWLVGSNEVRQLFDPPS